MVSKKKKVCTKGYSCGISCISVTKACRKEFPDGVAVMLDSRKILRASAYEPKAREAKEGFPATLDKLEKVKRLGGSTGALLMKDPDTGKMYVLKKGNSPEHAYEEFLADRAYEALGVPVPKGKFYGKDTKLSEYIEGRALGELSGKELADAQAQLGKHFVADALLSNWDVTGMSGDNVLVANDGTVYRIDNGGSFRYRAQGAPKGSAFGDKVTELSTLRDSDVNYYTAGAFRSVTEADIATQKKELVAKKEELLAAIPDKELRSQVERRLESFREVESTPSSNKLDPLGVTPLLGVYTYSVREDEVNNALVEKGVFDDFDQARRVGRAVNDFTEMSYAAMRKSDKYETPDDRVKAVYEGFLNNSRIPTYKGTVYRGLGSGFSSKLAQFKSLEVGDQITLDSLSSFSSNRKTAEIFAYGTYSVLMKVKANKSGKSVKAFSEHPSENEILVPKGVSYKVSGTKLGSDGKSLELELEEI